MAKLESVAKLKDVPGVEIEMVVYYNEWADFDEGEIFFRHPLTGDKVQTVNQILYGWEEQENDLQKHWECLVESIKSDKELIEKIFNGMHFIEYVPVKFYINHNTGAGNDWEATLEKAEKTAMFSANYTGKSITIEDEDDNVLACLPWHNYPATADDEAIIELGNFGFYSYWERV